MDINFNGSDLSQQLKVLDAERSLLPSIENTVTKVTARNGGFFDWDRLESRIITVKYVIETEGTAALQKAKRKLAGLLKTSEPQKLIFDDEPDVYYMAKLDSDTPISQTLGVAEGVLTFICIDPLAYSNSVKSTDEIVESALSIPLEATADTYPTVTAKFNSECGYLSLINQDGRIVQIGNPEELDKVAFKRNETVINESFSATSQPATWKSNVAVLPYPNYLGNPATPNRQDGTYNWNKTADGIVPEYKAVTSAVKGWGGAAITRDIPVNSEGSATGNFKSPVRFWMKQGEPRATNRNELILESNGKVMAAAILRDSSVNIQDYVFELRIWSKIVGSITLPVKDYQKGFFEMDIIKEGDTLTFTVSEIASLTTGVNRAKSVMKSFTMVGIAESPVTRASLWSAKNSGHSALYSEWTDFRFTWINVDKIAEIPNQFQPDDELTVDFKDGAILHNGVENLNLGDIGNDFFPLSMGDNKIYIGYSEWAENPPEVSVKYREAWL